jgi:16S rRNA (cytosine967-C5)-methyltransferase
MMPADDGRRGGQQPRHGGRRVEVEVTRARRAAPAAASTPSPAQPAPARDPLREEPGERTTSPDSASSSGPPSSGAPSSRPRILEAPPLRAQPAGPPRRDGRGGGGGGGGGSGGGGRKRAALPVTARNVASEVIARVERDGAFAAAVLDHELRRAVQLSPRDRALATELVYGTLRLLPLLERSVVAATPRGISTLDARTRAIVLVAAYQIHFTRIPAFAAVSEAVDAIRMLRGRAISGFANGALRQVARTAELSPLPRPPQAFRDATAPWLRRALERSIGDDATEALLIAGPHPPPTNLRVRARGEDETLVRDRWIERLRAAHPAAMVEPGAFAPLAIRVRGAGDPQALEGWSSGDWTIQEEGSQLIAELLGARPGDRVLDACAGRGNKSSLLAERLGFGRPGSEPPAGALEVSDVHPEKLLRLVADFARLGLPAPATHAIDWALGAGDLEDGSFDRVLVDAPCSGTGTIRRRPEIQTRRQPADLPSLAALQTKILEHAAQVVKPGGRLIYAVCSVLRDEAETVVRAVLDATPMLEPVPFDAPIASALFGEGATQGRLLTHLHGTDAYFVASLRRRD